MVSTTDQVAIQARMKKVDLASGVGAAILGGGVGVLAAPYLGPYAVLLVVVGIVMHAWASSRGVASMPRRPMCGGPWRSTGYVGRSFSSSGRLSCSAPDAHLLCGVQCDGTRKNASGR